MVWVLHSSPTSGTDKVLLLGIANHADADGHNAWPSVATLARYANLEPRGVKKALRRLEEQGHILIAENRGGNADTRSDRRPNRYTVVMNAVSAGTPRKVNGVSPSTERGVLQDRNGVSHRTPEPSLEPSLNLSSASRPRDELWDCVVDVFGYSTDMTSLERGRINKALKSLRDVGASPDELRRRAFEYRKRFPNVAFTPMAVASNWSQLEGGKGSGTVERCRRCAQPSKGHDEELCAMLQGVG
jgi:hypothetical protein